MRLVDSYSPCLMKYLVPQISLENVAFGSSGANQTFKNLIINQTSTYLPTGSFINTSELPPNNE